MLVAINPVKLPEGQPPEAAFNWVKSKMAETRKPRPAFAGRGCILGEFVIYWRHCRDGETGIHEGLKIP